MRITQIRNATVMLEFGEHKLLVDPMFCRPGVMPSFKLFGGGGQKNPLVPLPLGAKEQMHQATAVAVTHEHPDHLDPKALVWARREQLPVWCGQVDVPSLRGKGLRAKAFGGGDFGVPVAEVPTTHGYGVLGWLMGPVTGFCVAPFGEPRVYITGDTVLTDNVKDALLRLRPDVVIAPAGGANFGVGGSVILPEEEVLELAGLAPGDVILNHLEALDHCLTTRAGLREKVDARGIGERVWIPEDGESRVFEQTLDEVNLEGVTFPAKSSSMQKWLTAKMSGTQGV